MISDDDAAARGYWFNYKPDQWAAIDRQIARIAEPTEPFSDLELLGAANAYLDDNFMSRRDRAAAFRKMAEDAERLRLGIASSLACDHVEAAPVLDECLKSLEKLTSWARYNLMKFHLGGTAKEQFYRTVLECWGDAGGLFRRSRPDEGAASREASGPTVLYVEAAVAPVMGEEAPGREAICKLIVRHREYDAEMQREVARALRRARKAKRPDAVQQALLDLDRER